jgi:peptidoglycan/LPS O-acetylase OafA/YrhL
MEAPPPARPVSTTLPTFGWHPSLAGIRGFAILLVVGFHMDLPLRVGGPVGVTVFFVLSGFLITSLLVNEAARAGVIDLVGFYTRRVRRLFPALLAAVFLVLGLEAFAGRIGAVATDSVLALTYISNWARAAGDGMGLWNHTWSLGIEEQFYLVWPVGFIALRRFAAPTSWRFIALLLALTVGSGLLRLALLVSGASGDRVYFGSDTRAEAILAGCVLACLFARPAGVTVPRWVGPLSIVALFGLAIFDTEPYLWPGATYSLVAVASCGLIAAAMQPGRQWLGMSSTVMVWFGERSYSLYIWHVPVILTLGVAMAGFPPVVRFCVVGLACLALAVGSYEFVERPFRRSRSS